MTTSYPGALDNFTNPAATDPLSNPAHAAQHANANDAIEAIEATLGTAPAGTAATVSARIANMESYIPTIGSAVGAAQLAASQSATSASAAAVYAGTAQVAAGTAVSVWQAFDARYLGSKATNPTVDNQGNPLTTGALYFNTTANIMYAYGATSVWQSIVAALPSTIVANSSTPALQITQAGSGPALLVEDETSDLSPFVVTSTGAVGIGTVSPSYSLHVVGTVNASALLVNGSALDLLPSQTGNTGKFLTTDGSVASWGSVSALPSQTGNSGKYLTTDGTAASWAYAGARGGGTNQVFWENDTNVSVNYTLTAGKNALSGGPITVDAGVTVTVPSGSTWSVV